MQGLKVIVLCKTEFSTLIEYEMHDYSIMCLFCIIVRDPNDMHRIRQMTGVCPQHDILFDMLTPREHLEFFAAVRVSVTLYEAQVHHRKQHSGSILWGL
jgi:ABC-type Na+ transport system ATPase subunit NatA